MTLLKNRLDIIEWLEKHQVKNYTLVPNEKYGFVVDVDGQVNLFGGILRVIAKRLTSIDVKFNIIKGGFYCDNNHLTSLQGCPEIVYGQFTCHDNTNLKSLEYCPVEVHEIFCAHSCDIESLIHCPKVVKKIMMLHENPKLGEMQQNSDFETIYKVHCIEKSFFELQQKIINEVALNNMFDGKRKI